MAAVGRFVEAGKVSFAGGHDDGGVVVESLDRAEVEVLAGGRLGAGLPDDAGVFGPEDGAVGAEAQATPPPTLSMPRRSAVV